MTPTQGEHAQTEALRLAEIIRDWCTDCRIPLPSDDECARLVAALAAATAQPATPQGVAYAELPEVVIDAVAAALGDAYDCCKTWSAWSYGTMHSDDFSLVAEDGERVAEIARAAINAYRASNGQAPAAQQAGEVHPRHPVVVKWRDNGIEACAGIADAYGCHDAARDMRAMLTNSQEVAAQKPVARIEGIDEYGPRIEWLKHWVDVGVGARFYTAPQPHTAQAAPAAGAVAWTVEPPNAITASVMRDDGGEQPAFCLMAAYRSEKDAMDALAMIAAAPTPAAQADSESAPIDMVLHCPACGLQHIDAADTPVTVLEAVLRANPLAMPAKPRWANPPHRSHLCHGCGHIWRPADVPTNGVAAVKTTGKADSPIAAHSLADSVLEDAARLDWLALAGPTSICVVLDRENDGEVEVSTDDVTGYGKTLREALDAARKQGGA